MRTATGSALLLSIFILSSFPAAAAEDSAVVIARPGAGDATVLDLEACVSEALQNNDLLVAEKMRRRELDGQMKQALATGLPTIDAAGTWSRGRDPSFALDETFGGGGDGPFSFPPSGSAMRDTVYSVLGGFAFIPDPQDIPAQSFWRTSLNMHWDLNPMKIVGAVKAAGRGIERQDLAVVGAIQTTEETVIRAYHGIILAGEHLAAVQADLANQREFLEIMKMRFDLGTATELDTLQAAVAVANIEPQLRQAEQGLRVAGSRLNAAMGRDPEAPIAIRNDQPVETDPISRSRALAMALERPDLRQVGLVSELLRQNRRAQKADLLPSLSLDGTYGLVGREFGDLTNEGHNYWNAIVAFNVPVFDGLLTRGTIQQTEASLLRNEAELSGLRRQARVDVLDLLGNLDAARKNLEATRLNMKRSEELLDTSKMMLRLGKADYLTVLESEANRSLARSNLIRARYDVLTYTASLKRAIGISPMLPLVAVDGLVKGDGHE